jgi:hypothetical protein
LDAIAYFLIHFKLHFTSLHLTSLQYSGSSLNANPFSHSPETPTTTAATNKAMIVSAAQDKLADKLVV